MRKYIALVAALVTALALAVPAGAGSLTSETLKIAGNLDPYVVILDADPVVAYDGDIAGLPATAPKAGKKINPNSAAVKKYEKFLDKQRGQATEKAKISNSAIVSTFNYALTGFTALLTAEEAEKLAAQKNVVSVTKDYLRELHTDTSPDFLGLTDPNGAWASGYDGEGVIVGVVDTGIWPEHPSFADDGSYPEPPASWTGDECDFGNTAYNPEDDPFTCNNKLIGARNMRALYDTLIPGEPYHSARDYDGHGTHTASTAAGNANVEATIFDRVLGIVSGIAPRAHVAMYAACGELGCFGGDLADAIDQSVADGVDVLNYSIGSSTPGLDGPDDIAFLFAAAADVFVATSNGNAGPGASTIGSPATVPWITSVGASTHDRRFEADAILGNGETYTGASVTPALGTNKLVDAAELKNELCDPDVKFKPAPKGDIVLCKRGAIARVAKSQAVFEQGGVGMILYNTSDTQTLATDNHYVPTVHVSYSDGLEIKEYIASTKQGNGKGKALGKKAEASLTAGTAAPGPGSVMADFSSRGPVGLPASSDLIKPDVTAPGVQILAGNTPTPLLGAPGQLFQSIQGTSMSSPHVAGLFALLKQAHPDWSAAAAKSAVMTTARQDVVKEDGTTPADPFDMGAGHVDPSGDVDAPNSMFNPGIVYDAGLFEYAAFTCGQDLGIFSPGSCVFLDSVGVPSEAYNLNVPSIGVAEVAGTKTVSRTVTNISGGSLDLTANVEAPSGYNVTVNPSGLSLADGESATFDVVFTNVSGPVDEWRFGALTWEGSGYEARSPIAVKAAQLEAPASVSADGVEGETSFDITFGYTGEYDAAAHGLVGNVEIEGTVGQDPDQTFDPSDVGNGATAHEIVLSGSAFLRITLNTDDLTPPDPAYDIDLFLYKDGEEVASSGAGSTNEIIELTLPEDGTYTLYVHGWQTAGTTVGYSVNTWDVPAAADSGSLTIVSEPENATIGATETIVVGWSGLETGMDYLGAVSHSDGSGIMGLTLVEVSTE